MASMDDEERELYERLRTLESITPRIRAAELGMCAIVEWRVDDLGTGRITICEMRVAD